MLNSPCPNHEGTEGVLVKLNLFFTLVLDGGEWSTSGPRHYTSKERTHFPLNPERECTVPRVMNRHTIFSEAQKSIGKMNKCFIK